MLTFPILVFLLLATGKYGKNEINKRFKQKTQILQSYSLKFHFTYPSDILEYLNGKEIILKPPIS